MFCENCGNKLNENEQFCSQCGNKVPDYIMQTCANSDKNVSVENVPIKNTINTKEVLNKIKVFFNKYKKQIIIGTSGIGIIVIGFILFNNLYGTKKLSWNNEYEVYNTNYITASTIELGVNLDDPEEIDKIKYEVNCGTFTNEGLEISWDLNDAIGKCKIVAKYKLQKISKEYNVLSTTIEKESLALEEKIDLDSDEDLDLDGLTNKEEKKYKTDPVLSDTDMDGLDDNYEILTSKTDPNKADTDGDGLTDGAEFKTFFDPLKKDSKGDGIVDGKREIAYTHIINNVTLNIKGTGNIANTKVDINDNTKISNKDGLIDKLYTFYTEGKLDEADVKIAYTMEELEKYNINEDNLTLYYYNEKELNYEKVATTIDKDNKTISATLKHFSNYVVGDSQLVKEYFTNQILFVLDNSWSLYTDEQFKEITGEENSNYDPFDGFDEEGLRFTLTSELVTSLADKSYEIGLSEFRSDYANALPIGSKPKDIKEKLNNMYGNFITKKEGTNITNALNKGIEDFSKDSDNKYIVLLTDGQDTSLKRNIDDIVEKAKESNVKICSVGFGGGSYNESLEKISEQTGCEFYSSSNAMGLEELFTDIEANLSDDLVDIDNDGKMDGLMIADSGFVVNRDGFSFSNYSSDKAGGHCFGMAMVAEFRYKGVLPLKLESKEFGGQKSYAYNLRWTDFDSSKNLYDFKLKTNELKHYFGFDYFEESEPTIKYEVKNNNLVFQKSYKDIINSIDFYETYLQESSLNSKEQIKKYGAEYESAEDVRFNEEKINNSKMLDNDEKQMFNAIYAHYLTQNEKQFYSSGVDLKLFLRNVLGAEETIEVNGPGFIEIIKERLDDKDPVLIAGGFSGGLHAVNAIDLIQDLDDPNYYYIGVYDNNYPGEKRYIDVKCNEITCSTRKNKYYSKSNKAIRVTTSLDYDLEFYK